jgi:hypothetical protein
MKNLKLIVLSTLFLCFFNYSNSQRRKMGTEQKTEQREKFKNNMEKLNLSDDQKTKFIDIQKKYGEQMKSLHQSGEGKANAEAMKSLINVSSM